MFIIFMQASPKDFQKEFLKQFLKKNSKEQLKKYLGKIPEHNPKIIEFLKPFLEEIRKTPSGIQGDI